MSHFVLAMAQHGDVLCRAQKEVDVIVGRDRLPTFEDRANLPYGEMMLSLPDRYWPLQEVAESG